MATGSSFSNCARIGSGLSKSTHAVAKQWHEFSMADLSVNGILKLKLLPAMFVLISVELLVDLVANLIDESLFFKVQLIASIECVSQYSTTCVFTISESVLKINFLLFLKRQSFSCIFCSMELKFFWWASPMLVKIPISGEIIFSRFIISSGREIPASKIPRSKLLFINKIDSGTPICELKLFGLLIILNSFDKISCNHSLIMVLPLLPVIPIIG